VSGVVRYNGQNLKGGTVSFIPTDGGAYTATIGEDGTYTAVSLPAGEMAVTVSTQLLNPNAEKQQYGAGKAATAAPRRGQTPSKAMVVKEKSGIAKQNEQMAKALGLKISPDATERSARYVAIPAKYGKPDETPLKVTLGSGSNQHDFDLTD
jgi:hypothetical protein